MIQSKLTYGPIAKDEAKTLWSIIYQSLHRHAQPGWNEHVGYERFRAVRSTSKILGGMGIIDMGQWFGGKIVRTGAVTSVGVAPEGRGIGAASVLLKNSLSEMYESGIPISTLFPSSTRVYRSFGYERSGTKLTYETKVKDMKSSLNDLEVIETKAGDREETYLLYNERAASSNGN
ncbi:MAG: GNAT family N-acetyltransferase, partial [Chloroflexota bacterium]|nr:GNAT family N-acetyltransferase [Chloroflexota bacterium]